MMKQPSTSSEDTVSVDVFQNFTNDLVTIEIYVIRFKVSSGELHPVHLYFNN